VANFSVKTGGWKGGPKKREWRNPLGKNQCAYCKTEGQWKNECPNRKKGKRKWLPPNPRKPAT
jgi:hypothetical protein